MSGLTSEVKMAIMCAFMMQLRLIFIRVESL